MDHVLPTVSPSDIVHIDHNSIKKWICSEFNKDVLSKLSSSGSDWLILDPGIVRDGLFTLYFDDNQYEYFSSIYHGDITNLIKNMCVNYSSSPVFKPNSFYISETDEGIKKFIDFINKRYGNKIILLDVAYTTYSLDKNGNMYSLGSSNEVKRLEMINFVHKIINNKEAFVVHFPYNIISDAVHKWGPSQLHYIDEFYKYGYKCIRFIVENYSDPLLIQRQLDVIFYDYLNIVQEIRCGFIRSVNNSIQYIKNNLQLGNSDLAITRLHELSNCNNSDVYYLYAHIFLDGKYVDKDLDSAIKWLRKAADLNPSFNEEFWNLLLQSSSEEYHQEDLIAVCIYPIPPQVQVLLVECTGMVNVSKKTFFYLLIILQLLVISILLGVMNCLTFFFQSVLRNPLLEPLMF